MLKKLFLFLIIFSVLFACKKENDHPQWVVQAVAPIFHATLGVNDLFADSLIETDSSKLIHLVFEDSLYNQVFNVDSLFRIPDTLIPTVLTMPFVSYVLQPNSPFYASNQDATLGISGAALRKVIIKSGYLRIEARNRLQTRVVYTYTIPGTTFNGTSFTFTTTLNAALPGGFSSYSNLFDMTGYVVDLTGSSGNDFNTISYNIAARSDTGGGNVTVFMGDTMVNLQAGFQDMIPYYAAGYLGQTEIQENSNSTQTDFFGLIQYSNIRLEEATMKFTIENNIGVDAQAFIIGIQSVNAQTSTLVNLNSPSIVNHAININRASESGNSQHPVIPTTTSVKFDNSNSNLKSLIENFPDHLNYSLKLKVNPLGNISGNNDFIYTDYLVHARISVDIPLSFAADQLALADTAPFSVGNTNNFDPVGAGTFSLIADNGFPFDASLKLLVLDENNMLLDSIFVPGVIAAADVDASYHVIAPKRTRIPMYVDETKKQRILQGKNLSILANFTTPAFPQYYRFYSGYKLDLKLVGDAAYLIH